MAREQFEVELTADDSASPTIDRVADSLDDLTDKPTEVELDADVSRALSALEDVATETKRTQAAAEALSQALGPELTGRADTTAIVGDLRQMGLSLDQITSNADQLGSKLRELSDTDVGGRLGANLGTTRGQIDKMSDSARGANSALANMVGNAAQDMGALGGVAGSAGVAIGQMAEYAADAKLAGEGMGSALGSMAKVAGPIAGIGIALSLVSSYMDAIAAKEAFNREQVDGFADALADAVLSAEELNSVLAQGADAGFMARIANNTRDIIPQLVQTGTTFEDVSRIVQGGADDFDNWAASQLAAASQAGASEGQIKNLSSAIQRIRDDQTLGDAAARAYGDGFGYVLDSAMGLAQAMENLGTANLTAAERQEFYGDSLEDTATSQDRAASSADSASSSIAQTGASATAAAANLSQLEGALRQLPPDVQTQVRTLIEQGDLQGALALIQTTLGGVEATVDVAGNVEPADAAISSVTEADHPTVIVAEPDIARADAALATLARDRRMTVIASADTDRADGALATAARDRRMTVIASADIGAADRALDSLTAQRSVTIVPRVAPTTVLVRVDGGG